MPKRVLLYLLAGLEKQRHCWYLSRLLPQHSAHFTAQSCQAESVINFSHVAIDPIFIEITVLFQRKLTVVAYKPLQHLLECQTCSQYSRNTCQAFNST